MAGPVTCDNLAQFSEPTLNTLSPQKREEIRAKLAGVTEGNRDLFERRFILEAMAQNSYRLRVLAGPGPDANPYQRECFGILREIYDLESEALTLRVQLDAKQVGTDPLTGDPVELPFPLIAEAARRAAMEERHRLLTYQVTLLEGHEGQKRKDEALERTKAEIRQREEDASIAAEIERRAHEKVREARIEKAAEAKARFLKPTGL